MRVLVGCESSGTVRRAFRALGHDAWSCDLLAADDGSPHHIVGDVREAIAQGGWDLGIFHPPCTRLCNSGVHWLARRNLWAEMEEGARLFRACLDAPIARVCVENPVMHRYAVAIVGRKADQTIQPYEFGHPESKRTGLWLRNLPQLKRTAVLEVPEAGHWENQTASGQNRLAPSPDRWKLRSKTYDGIAAAMAAQWGALHVARKAV